MPITPIDVFENTIERALHLVRLYDLLHNKGKRGARKGWKKDVSKLLGWREHEKLKRIDSPNAILLIKDGTEWNFSHFESEYLDEILRSALVTAVSAVDRYLHDIVVMKSLDLLKQSDCPKRLSAMQIALCDVERIIQKSLASRKNDQKKTRPRTILKDTIREILHKESFQGFESIGTALSMAGIDKGWTKLKKILDMEVPEIKKRINGIVNRRNRIVHEGDIARGPKPREIKLNEIKSPSIQKDIEWLKSFVLAVQKILES